MKTSSYSTEASTWAEQETKSSRLPGTHNGPGDAFRHIIWIAEEARTRGSLPAWAMGEANEIKGNYRAVDEKDRQKPDEATMGRSNNNEIALRIARAAKSREDVVRLAKAEIAASFEHGGSGANGTARYLPKERWGDIEGHGPRDNWPPAWKDDAALRVERLLTLPVEDWTEDDVRAVQASRRYWQSGNPRQAEAFEKVKSWFESSEARRRNQLRTSHGPVTVDPYTRGDGTKVDGHTRSAPVHR